MPAPFEVPAAPPAPSRRARRRHRLRPILQFLAVHVGAWFLKALMATWRFKIAFPGIEFRDGVTLRRRSEDDRVIYAFWHSRLLVYAKTHRNSKVCVMISQHSDGDMSAAAIRRFGMQSVRGSTTRGATGALKGILQRLRTVDIAFTPDGPRGPRYRVQRGVIMAASLTGKPIVFGTFGCARAWVFNSWDRMVLPKPFATIVISGNAFSVLPNLDAAAMERTRTLLEDRMRALTAHLDRQCGRPMDSELAAEGHSATAPPSEYA